MRGKSTFLIQKPLILNVFWSELYTTYSIGDCLIPLSFFWAVLLMLSHLRFIFHWWFINYIRMPSRLVLSLLRVTENQLMQMKKMMIFLSVMIKSWSLSFYSVILPFIHEEERTQKSQFFILMKKYHQIIYKSIQEHQKSYKSSFERIKSIWLCYLWWTWWNSSDINSKNEWIMKNQF